MPGQQQQQDNGIDQAVTTALDLGGEQEGVVENDGGGAEGQVQGEQTALMDEFGGGKAKQPDKAGGDNRGGASAKQQANPRAPAQKQLGSPTPGAEQRFYREAQQAKARMQSMDREMGMLKAQLTTLQEAGGVGAQLGLQPGQQVVAMQLMAKYIQDPVGTLKYMLEEAKAAGHNVNTLLQSGAGIDTAALGKLIETKLRPITQQQEQQQQMQRVQQEAAGEANRFFASYPEARMHEQALAQLLLKDEQLTPDAAWFKLQLWAHQNGLDINQPLLPQLQGQGGQQRGVTTNPRPLGRNNANGGVRQMSEPLAANARWEDIIKSAVNESRAAQTR